jgi:hypothetical protein
VLVEECILARVEERTLARMEEQLQVVLEVSKEQMLLVEDWVRLRELELELPIGDRCNSFGQLHPNRLLAEFSCCCCCYY